MAVIFEPLNHQPKDHSISDDIIAIFQGLSWLTLVVAPWSLLAFLLHLVGLVNLSTPELWCVGILVLGALSQLVYARFSDDVSDTRK